MPALSARPTIRAAAIGWRPANMATRFCPKPPGWTRTSRFRARGGCPGRNGWRRSPRPRKPPLPWARRWPMPPAPMSFRNEAGMSGRLTNRTFDQLQIGDRAELVREVGPDDITLFAAVSGDNNPAHVDAAFAAGGPFG